MSDGLVHPPGTVCKWCKLGEATTILYGWPTCIACVAGGPKVRVRAYLSEMKQKNAKEPRVQRDP